MRKAGGIGIIARAVIVKNGKMLLCHGKADDYYFFPGGHVEFGEKVETALIRELVEEIGLQVSYPRLVGILGNRFTEKGFKYHEINFVYYVALPTSRVHPDGIHSAEDHIEFVWMPLARLGKERILPRPLCRLVMKWRRDKKFFAADI